jgi:hypothetical protein
VKTEKEIRKLVKKIQKISEIFMDYFIPLCTLVFFIYNFMQFSVDYETNMD